MFQEFASRVSRFRPEFLQILSLSPVPVDKRSVKGTATKHSFSMEMLPIDVNVPIAAQGWN